MENIIDKSCATSDCSEQHREAQQSAPEAFCAICGAPLSEGQAFCPKCGAPRAAAPKSNLCTNCGNELEVGQEFCPNCGQKAGTAIQEFNADAAQGCVPKKKKPMGIIIGAIAAVVVIIAAILVVPKLMVSVESLCAEGKYLEAYEMAEGEEKLDVLAENIIAVLSQECIDGFNDPSVFILRDAWHYRFMHKDGAIGGYAILYISGANSVGGMASEYFAFTLGSDEEWNYIGSTSVTYDESGDDIEMMLIKIIVNAGMEKGAKLAPDQVQRINDHFEAKTLYLVNPIDWAVVDTSSFPVA